MVKPMALYKNTLPTCYETNDKTVPGLIWMSCLEQSMGLFKLEPMRVVTFVCSLVAKCGQSSEPAMVRRAPLARDAAYGGDWPGYS